MAGGSLGRGRGTKGYRPMAEINVTSFVDVTMVLLIVFMITAPLLTAGVEIDLPTSDARALTQAEEPLTIAITAEGTLYLQETEVAEDSLVPRLIAITENNTDVRLYVRADRAQSYGTVMRIMGLLNRAGFTRIALIADPTEG